MLGNAAFPVEVYAMMINYLSPHDLLQLSLTNRYHYHTTLDFLPGMGVRTTPEQFLYWAIEHDDAALVAKYLTPEMLEVRFPVFPGSYAERRLRARATGVNEYRDTKTLGITDDQLSLWIVCLIYRAWEVLDPLLASGLELPSFERGAIILDQVDDGLRPFGSRWGSPPITFVCCLRHTPLQLCELFAIYGEPVAEAWGRGMLRQAATGRRTIGPFMNGYVLSCRADFPATARPAGRSNDYRFCSVTSTPDIRETRKKETNNATIQSRVWQILGLWYQQLRGADPCTPCAVGNIGILLTSNIAKNLRSHQRVLCTVYYPIWAYSKVVVWQVDG
jgi:hypothetical protein